MTTPNCPACLGSGGFNQFFTVQGDGTTEIWLHRWIPCSLCDAWAKLSSEISAAMAEVEGLKATIEELNKPQRKHRAKKENDVNPT